MNTNIVELAQQGRAVRQCRIENSDFIAVNLKKLRADGLTLKFCRLTGSDLMSINWHGCELDRVNLDNVNFANAIMRQCEFKNIAARQVNFSAAVIENCQLQGSDFEGCDFDRASLMDSDFSRARLAHANMQAISAAGANFRGTDFSGANLKAADFTDADLRGADFSGALLESVDFDGADLRGAIFDDPTLFVETPQTTEQEQPFFSPPVQALADSLAPVLVSMIEQGKTADLYDATTQEKWLAELQKYAAVAPLNTDASSAVADTFEQMLKQVSKTGIGPLWQALSQIDDADEPSQAVKNLLLGLADEFGIEGDNTVEDLLKQIVGNLKQSAPTDSD